MARAAASEARLEEMQALLRVVGRVWRACPELRLGQLIANALPPHFRCDPFYVADRDLIDGLTTFAELIDV